MRQPVFGGTGGCDQVRLKLSCSATEASNWDIAIIGIMQSRQHTQSRRSDCVDIQADP